MGQPRDASFLDGERGLKADLDQDQKTSHRNGAEEEEFPLLPGNEKVVGFHAVQRRHCHVGQPAVVRGAFTRGASRQSTAASIAFSKRPITRGFQGVRWQDLGVDVAACTRSMTRQSTRLHTEPEIPIRNRDRSWVKRNRRLVRKRAGRPHWLRRTLGKTSRTE